MVGRLYLQSSSTQLDGIYPRSITEHHTFQLDFDLGYIDRNVMGWDEFMAGGRHPYNWGNGTIGNNIQFSGFEGFSLSGETMLIANATYRFPLLRDRDQKWGPVYFDSLYVQFLVLSEIFGVIVWKEKVILKDIRSFLLRRLRSKGDSFVDYASKNSLPLKNTII